MIGHRYVDSDVTILVVDDELSIRTVLEALLSGPGRRLIVADDGEGALRRVEGVESIDVALVDKNLPGMGGLSVVRELKSRYPFGAFMLMTAYPTTDSATEAVRLGLFDYISKPFVDLESVERLVARAIESSRLARDRARSLQEVEDQHRNALVAARRVMQAELTRSANHDQLTGLLNRQAFVGCVDSVLGTNRAAPGNVFAVVVMDLDDFGQINDSLGHTAGDDLLRQWTARVAELIRPNDVLARIGADQFILLVHDVPNEDAAIDLARRLAAAASHPLLVGGHKVSVTCSVGICLREQRYQKAEDMIRDAGTALAKAKVMGKAGLVVFAAEMHSQALEKLALDQQLKTAVDRREFVPFFQPIVSVETGRLVAFEALARWRHPDRGLLAPGQFLVRAIATDRLSDISWQIAQEACVTQRRWLDMFGSALGLTMNLNITPSLLLKRDFVPRLAELASRLGLEPARIKVEVTEAVAMDDTSLSAETMQSLRRLGFIVCLDDFGTGYASLRWLHQFPVDEIKVDKSFVAHLHDDRRSQVLVGAAINLAHSLGLPVVAEGVETQPQMDELKALACEYAQGYLFSAPVAGDVAEDMIRRSLPHA